VAKKRNDQRQRKRDNIFKWLPFLSPKSSSSSTTTSSEEWENRKDQLFAIGIGLSAMIIYALAVGLIKFDVVKTDIEYSEKLA
jgi:hypothetical protein